MQMNIYVQEIQGRSYEGRLTFKSGPWGMGLDWRYGDTGTQHLLMVGIIDLYEGMTPTRKEEF